MNPENEPPIVAISPLQQQRKPNMAPKNESPIVAFSPLQQHRDEEEYVPEQPTLFVAMGSPTLLIEQSEAHDFLREMGRRFHFPERRPECVVCVSARWVSDSDKVKVMSNPYPKTVHDFFGFAECLNEVEYAATCDSEMSAKVAEALENHDIPWEFDGQRGYDFGCWSPMALLFPSADIPVVQVSLHASLEPDIHFRIGEALGGLRESNFLVVCSGGLTHNLMDISFGEEAIPPSAITFEQWVQEVMRYEENRSELITPEEAWGARNRRLARWQEVAEGVVLAAKRCHPTPEYYLPLCVASASGGSSSVIHRSWSLGCLSMAAFMFGLLPPMRDRAPKDEQKPPVDTESPLLRKVRRSSVMLAKPLIAATDDAAAASATGESILGSEEDMEVAAARLQHAIVSHKHPMRAARSPSQDADDSARPAQAAEQESGDKSDSRLAMPDKIERPRTSGGSKSGSRPASRAMVRQAQESAAETDERKFVAMIELAEKGQFSHKARENDREQ